MFHSANPDLSDNVGELIKSKGFNKIDTLLGMKPTVKLLLVKDTLDFE